MKFVNRDHLGGFVLADSQYPNGDPATYVPTVWAWLLSQSGNLSTVLDVGCGQGHFVQYVRDNFPGVRAIGVDGLKMPLPGLEDTIVEIDFAKQDGASVFLQNAIPLEFDFTWSCEFVEHVTEQNMANYLSLFRCSKVLAMTHAFVGQPGHHHVNCQQPTYWINKIQSTCGLKLNETLTHGSRQLAPGSHWERSGLVFTRD